ncbi:hypothetical protein AZL_025170 [Azospirillum sp. B510]|uniref:metallophosphoesterase n=1 Tax=Azospirillum sp. (strain B510) TaxID=137722 RepID=UPI0001C4CB74|nr:metallophosphoesterase [Azospirillum sp. B510]BAI73155.1 hypothetical protein AZL_025170 [Azospirillum sp. B510]
MSGNSSPLAPLVTFGVVGDYGSGGIGSTNVIAQAATGVATAMKSFVSPSIPSNFVVSLGDQIYPPWSKGCENGAATAAEYIAAIGNLYGGFIFYPPVNYDDPSAPVSPNPYAPDTPTSSTMRLFPVIGDHDWWKQNQTIPARSSGDSPEIYLMKGNDNYQVNFAGLNLPLDPQLDPQLGTPDYTPCIRYYTVQPAADPATNTPLIQLFALSNDQNEVALGTLFTKDSSSDNLLSPQIQWFTGALSDSQAVWNIVSMHQPPYSSSNDHGPTTYFQLVDLVANTVGKTVDLVLAGHIHSYERFQNVDQSNGLTTYIVNGTGGTLEGFASFKSVTDTSPIGQVRVTGYYGFQVATVSLQTLTLAFYGSTDPANASQAPSGPSWTAFDVFMIVKPNTTLTLGDMAGLTGLLIQGVTDSSGATSGLTIDTGGQTATLPLNLYGPGSLTVTGGGTLTVTAAPVPTGFKQNTDGSIPSVYYEQTQTGPTGPIATDSQTTLVLYGTNYPPSAENPAAPAG